MATFFDSLKKWFYTKNSSAASSDARVPLLDASGNPKGSDTMANLASVLGGNSTELYSGVDFNTLVDGKNYFGYAAVFANSSNTPNTNAGTFKLLVNKDTSESYIIQTCFMYSGVIFIRTRNNDGDWTSWHTIAIDYPSFYKNYADLSSLANALGAVNGQYNGSLADLGQSVASYGFDVRAYEMACADAPKYNENDGYILTGVTSQSNGVNSYFQIATVDNNLYYRFYHGGLQRFIINWTPML